MRQKRGETAADYIQRFRAVRNRCFSSRISEREAINLAVLGLIKPLKDVAFQLEFNSLAHLIQKLSSYEQYHLELYLDKFQDKFKRAVNIVEMDSSEDGTEEYE